MNTEVKFSPLLFLTLFALPVSIKFNLYVVAVKSNQSKKKKPEARRVLRKEMQFDFDFDAFENRTHAYIKQAASPLADLQNSIEVLGDKSLFFRLPQVDEYLDSNLGAPLGVHISALKSILMFFIAYPMAIMLRILPSVAGKHLASATFGLFLLQWCFGPGWIHAFITSLVTYLICKFAPKKYCASLTVVWAMGYLTFAHILNYTHNYLDLAIPIDYTGTQMVLTMKLTSFAYNCFDGTDPEVKKNHEDDGKKRIYADRKKYAIQPENFPNILEYFGYMFCFPCLIAGPAFEYNEYIGAITGKAYEIPKEIKDSLSADELKKRSVRPSPVLPALKLLFMSIIFLYMHMQIVSWFPNDKIYYDLEVIRTQSAWRRFLGVYLNIFGHRCKYYFVWKMAEGASILAGFGFSGYDKSGHVLGWNGISNMDIFDFETAPNLKTATKCWNKRTQKWLERYTYFRTNRSVSITYFISAFWHGIYPGYYLFFFPSSLLTELERLIIRKLNPIFAPGYNESNGKASYPFYYRVICTIMTMGSLHYCGIVFQAKTLARGMVAWNSYRHIPFMCMLAALFVLKFIIPDPKKKKSN